MTNDHDNQSMPFCNLTASKVNCFPCVEISEHWLIVPVARIQLCHQAHTLFQQRMACSMKDCDP